ncbi:MAG: hypothetical protein R3B70_41720 [Polyangiaceae bacterium]
MATADDDKDRDEAEDQDEAGDDEAGSEDAAGDDDANDSPADNAASDDGDDGDDGADEPEEAAAKAPPVTKAAPPAAAKPPAAGAAPPRPAPSAGLGKSVGLFVAVVGGLSLAMLVLGSERGGGGPQAPKWSDGQTVDVDITLVSTDRQDLACASGTELKGLHCGFEAPNKRWTKGDPNDDSKTLRPYSTTNAINFFAAGVWSQPALAPDKLPGTRFAVKCKLTIAGKMPRADVRWHEGEGWNNVTDWYTGSVSDCKIGSVQN